MKLQPERRPPMETLISDTINRLTELHPQLVDPSQLDETHSKAASDLSETQALLDEAKTELETTRGQIIKTQSAKTKEFEEAVFTRNQELGDLTSRCAAAQTDFDTLSAELAQARQFRDQIEASIVSLTKNI